MMVIKIIWLVYDNLKSKVKGKLRGLGVSGGLIQND